jgi:Uma2 family endonuclease
VTLLEYFNTSETLRPQELIFGAVRVADAPFVNHQRVVLRMALALHAHAEAHSAGEVLTAPIDVILQADPPLVLQPDLVFIADARMDMVRDRIYGAPDIAIEVLSPHPRIGRLDERVNWFAQHGVPEIWLYHQPRRCLEILDCADGLVRMRRTLGWTDVVRSAILPELRTTVRSLVERSPLY